MFSTLLHEFTEANVVTAARTARTPADFVDSVAKVSHFLLLKGQLSIIVCCKNTVAFSFSAFYFLITLETVAKIISLIGLDHLLFERGTKFALKVICNIFENAN